MLGATSRIADALTFCGMGFLLWLGLGVPNLSGSSVTVATVIAFAFIFAKPMTELAVNPAGFRRRLENRFGWTATYTSIIVVALHAAHAYEWRGSDRIELLGAVIILLALITLAVAGWDRAQKITRKKPAQILRALLTIGYAGTGGSLLAGQMQFAQIALAGLLLTQLAVWLFDKRPNRAWIYPISGLFLAIGIPLAMTVFFMIGHGLAIPLIASYVLGLALLAEKPSAATTVI